MPIIDRMKSAWNAFRSQEKAGPLNEPGYAYGATVYGGPSPSRTRLPSYNDRTIVTSIYTRMSIDVAAVAYRHVKLDDSGRYSEDAQSSLSTCFKVEANLDQGPRAFRQDVIMTLFGKGTVAIVPVDTAVDPQTNEIFDIYSLRVGEIVGWYPKHVRVSVWNEEVGRRQEVTLEKRFVAIVENPLYSVMNETSSTLQRLIRKLALLDAVDEQSSSGKLDLIIQLPYMIKTEARRQQAEQRREDIELQLKGSQYGIAYTDATEKITQLNRPSENNLLAQIEYLTKMLYGQLGITEEVMNGTADEKTMINYYNRAIEPVADVICEAMQRTFIRVKAVDNEEGILYFKDPFKFVPLSVLAEIVDKLTRNEVVTSNEIRAFIGMQPSKEPKADQLINSNMPVTDTQLSALNVSKAAS